MPRTLALAATFLFAVLVASCAPPVPPTPPAPPPAATPAPPEPTPTPVTPAPVEPAPPVWSLEGEPVIDVGLVLDVDTLSFVPRQVVSITRSGPEGVVALGSTAQPVRILGSTKGLHVATGEGARFSVTTADTIFFNLVEEGLDEPRLRWRGHLWRGAFKFFVNPRGRLTLASRVPLEAYLLGVVPGEIGALADDLLEAGRAQAIAARSYTLFYLGRRAKEGFDLYATVEDQVYGPTDSERPLATRCVETTRAEVALSEGLPIRANYSSTCGGITSEVWESWPADPLPYLKSRRDRANGRDHCAESRHYRWEERFTPDEFVRNLRRFAPERGVPLPKGGVGQLVDLRIARRAHSGRVWQMDVITTTGRIVIPGRELRWVLRRAGMPGSILRSTLVKADVRRNRATKEPIEVVVTGAGNGHGVGLCQTGALGMARAGVKGEDILKHYYAGIEIRRMY